MPDACPLHPDGPVTPLTPDRPYDPADGQCRVCWLLAGGSPGPGAPAVTTPRCGRLGLPLTDDEKADRDLYQLREWRWCLHERLPLGEAVCQCSGCGPKCPGYPGI